ncbi:MAG TPA: C1 family peptidase [Dehalococcoidia bacterium]
MPSTDTFQPLDSEGNKITSGTALPDPFDGRDFLYRSRLQPLPSRIGVDDIPGGPYILHQGMQSCTGHAVAAMINTVLVRNARAANDGAGRQAASGSAELRVSAPMLYYLARRYDEFDGEDDVGSSLRGALKGWSHHGVATERAWPAETIVRDLTDPEFTRHCAERPLGTYYRVSPRNLDDLQSAISELHAVVVTAVIDESWREPHADSDSPSCVITGGGAPFGLHSFAIIGYDHRGFIVQNSWGAEWGDDGLAILPYSLWIQCASDAWVARPGVPFTPQARDSRRLLAAVALDRANAPQVAGRDAVDTPSAAAPIDRFVVNSGRYGQLSHTGDLVTTVWDVANIFGHMRSQHDAWKQAGNTQKRHLVLYAHGAMNGEKAGELLATSQYRWWLENNIYPVNLLWESGITDALWDVIARVHGEQPSGGLLDLLDMREHLDRAFELIGKHLGRAGWSAMKQRAWAASGTVAVGSSGNPFGHFDWDLLARADAHAAAHAYEIEQANLPAGWLVVDALRKYIAGRREEFAVHLVGHSAGSILHAGLLQTLGAAGIPVETVSLLAPAITVGAFENEVVPLLVDVREAAVFVLPDNLERDDHAGPYGKSPLYLLARSLEAGSRPEDKPEVRILGLEKFATAMAPIPNVTVSVSGAGSAASAFRCDARKHGDFDNDPSTLFSVASMMLRAEAGKVVVPYTPNVSVPRQPSGSDATVDQVGDLRPNPLRGPLSAV